MSFEVLNETFKNPIIKGFHPDPSICKVGEDYYLVNSSFEWFPGVPLYHSRDLVNWELINYVLKRPEQLPMKEGLKPSEGIWAPTIRYHEGTYYMITTAQGCGGNFYVTTKDPYGDWSDPIYIKDAPGIDPTLYFDDDEKCYYLGCANLKGFGHDWPAQNGIYIQEINIATGELLGEKTQLTYGHGCNARWVEGPHIYKINNKYVLMAAEGGTGQEHAVTVFSSDNIKGPYTAAYINPVLTHRHLGKKYPITSIGHADLVQTQNGEWWAVALGVRPVEGFNMLGRETFLTRVEIEHGFPVFNPGEGKILLEDKRPNLPYTKVEELPQKDEFNDLKLSNVWSFLRTPYEKWYSLSENKGKLTINLRPEKLTELVNPSLVARRVQHFNYLALTKMSFSSKNENECAGFVVMQNNAFHYRLVKTGNSLLLIKVEKSIETIVAKAEVVAEDIVIGLKAEGLKYSFVYGNDENNLNSIGDVQDARVCSQNRAGGFIGSFIGMYASSNGLKSNNKAVFDWFLYRY